MLGHALVFYILKQIRVGLIPVFVKNFKEDGTVFIFQKTDLKNSAQIYSSKIKNEFQTH